MCVAKINEGLEVLGVPTAFDPAEGIDAGGSFLPSTIHPTNQSRSDARRAYYDPYINRTNFHVATGQQVTRILGELGVNSTFTATGVEVGSPSQ
jgi:choline dehydrogenase